MTNEELALQVQAGDAAAFEQLVAQNRGILHRHAWRLWCVLGQEENVYSMELADVQQLALMGLHGAAMDYDQGKGFMLTSYLRRQLLRAFRDIYGRQRNDPLNTADSTDKDLGEDGGGFTLLDTVPDAGAQEAMQAGEEGDFQLYTRGLLDSALAELPQAHGDAVRLHYLEGITLAALALEYGVSGAAVGQRIQCGLQGLREYPLLQEYREEYLSAKAYQGTGLRAFKERGASCVEALAEKREESERRRMEREEEQLRTEAEAWADDLLRQVRQP